MPVFTWLQHVLTVYLFLAKLSSLKMEGAPSSYPNLAIGNLAYGLLDIYLSFTILSLPAPYPICIIFYSLSVWLHIRNLSSFSYLNDYEHWSSLCRSKWLVLEPMSMQSLLEWLPRFWTTYMILMLFCIYVNIYLYALKFLFFPIKLALWLLWWMQLETNCITFCGD